MEVEASSTTASSPAALPPLPLPLPHPPSPAPSSHALVSCTECRRLCIVLLDGSSRTQLYMTAIMDVILPAIFKSSSGGRPESAPTHYVVLAYGDYPPASPAPVLTIYTGSRANDAQAAIQSWPFRGGAPIRNALHEGLAAALECVDRIRAGRSGEPDLGRPPLGSWPQGASLVIIACSMTYEDFHAHALARFHYGALGAEELVRELQRRSVVIQYYCPLASLAGTFVGILERVYHQWEAGGGGGEVIVRQVTGLSPPWTVRAALPEGMVRPATTSSSSSSSAAAVAMGSDTRPIPTAPPLLAGTAAAAPPASSPSAQTALETAVKQFLGAVLKMPPNQRADAIKQHLESPAYSTEYKQCLLAMVRQMQHQSSGSVTNQPPQSRHSSKGGMGSGDPSATGATPLAPARPTSASAIANSRPAIWSGRLAFKHSNVESYFDLAACPIANPKGVLPHSIPPVAEYHVENWPLVLAISSFVSIQSAAVVASVPISRLVELVPWAKEAATAVANADIASGFRGMLYAKQLVGLVRLGGGQQAMLVAARPHQLVGMIIARQEAARDGSAAVPGVGNTGSAPAAGAARPMPRYNLRSSTPVPMGRPAGAASVAPGSLPSARMTGTTSHSSGPQQAQLMGSQPSTTGSSSHPSLILTPEEILRQHRPGTASVPPLGTVSPPDSSTAATLTEHSIVMEDVFTALSAPDTLGVFDQLTMEDLTHSPTKPRTGTQDPLFFDGPY